MDWIGKLEEEQQEEQQRQAQAQAAKDKWESEERNRFQIVKNELCPVIEATISELKKRTGFELQMGVMDSSLVVRAPRQRRGIFCRINDHSFVVSNVSNDGKTVWIEAIKAGKIDRPGEPPDDMSYNDWYGTDETVIATRNDLDLLISEDIHLLLEWLVRLELQDKDVPPPEISSVQQKKEQRKAALLKASWGFVCGMTGVLLFCAPCFLSPFLLLVLSVDPSFARHLQPMSLDPHASFHSRLLFCSPLLFFGFISLFMGLQAISELKSLSIDYDGHGRAKWAIGLGVFDCITAVLAILKWTNR